MHQTAIFNEWGYPDRTYTVSEEEITKAGVGLLGNASYYRGRETLEVWVYEKKKIELFFNIRKLLVAWKTESTIKELKVEEPKLILKSPQKQIVDDGSPKLILRSPQQTE
jgi:hypothetical protein